MKLWFDKYKKADIRNTDKGRKDNSELENRLVLNGIKNHMRQEAKNFTGIGQNLPAVEALIPANVNSKTFARI